MSYEAAKATGLIATHCVCCGRDLLDAESVTLGIGPICREKHGFNVGIDPDARARANVLVHEAAAIQKTDVARVIAIAAEIEGLGLAKLAGIIRDRFVQIKLIVAEADEYVWDRNTRTERATGRKISVVQVHTPYHDGFRDVLYRHVKGMKRPVYDASKVSKFSGKPKFSHWEVRREDSRELLRVLAECFPGRGAWGSQKGAFCIPTVSEFESQFSTPAK